MLRFHVLLLSCLKSRVTGGLRGHDSDFRGWCDIIVIRIDNALHWRHNGHDSVSNHQPHECLLNRLFRRRSNKISKLHVTGLCAGNSPETGEFPAQMASNAENVSIWWRHHWDGPVIRYLFDIVDESGWNTTPKQMEYLIVLNEK